MEIKIEEKDNNPNNILDQDFFDTIKLSKKINSKISKINELTEFFKKTPNYIELPDIKSKLPDLFSLLLTNLNENNNNYVLAQMNLILVLGQTINKEENFRTFIKNSLPKLFDKFYLGNQKINENLIEMFNQFISFKILTIKDYFQYIENIPLEEEDNYRINIINFLYEQINKDESVLLNNIPKPINELIKKLINDNESDISEIASKILNILINRGKEQEKTEENTIGEDKNVNNTGDSESKGSESTSKFVTNIVSAIKKEKDKDELEKKISSEEKKEDININTDNNNNNEEKRVVNDDIIRNENDVNKNDNILQEPKKEEENKNNDNHVDKKEINKDENETIKNDIKTEINVAQETIEPKKEEKVEEQNIQKVEEIIEKKEEAKEEKKEEKVEDKKIEEKEEKKEEKVEEKKKEETPEVSKQEKLEDVKLPEKKDEKIIEQKDLPQEDKKNELEKNTPDKTEQKEKIEEKKNEENKKETEPIKELETNKLGTQTQNKEGEIINNDKILESKKSEEKKVDDVVIKGTSDTNVIKDKKDENINNNDDNKKNEEIKENTEAKKDLRGNKPKKEGVKRTGIKSQISKFRKNLGKNKKKDAFEFELVEKKKDGNIEKNEIIPEEKEKEKEKEDVNIEIKTKEQPKEEIKKDNIEEKKEESVVEKPPIKEEKKAEEKPKEEKIEKKEEITKKEEKIEKKEEIPKKEEKPQEEKPKEEKKPIKKEVKPKEVKKEIKKEEKKEEIPENKNEEITNNIDNPDENNDQAKKPNTIIAINQQSLNEFEKKLQLALEQEEKGGLLNKENLTEVNPAPAKQKKEDPKFDEIKSVLGKEIVDSLFSPKWEVKKHGFELINEFVNNKPSNSYNMNDLIDYMKLKLKNYKETNFNINREAINIYNTMIKKKILSKDLLSPIIIAYHEKLADIKLKDNLIDLIKNSFDIIEPSTILKQILGKVSKSKNAKLLIEYSTFLGNVVEEYDVKDLPNKEIIDFCKVMANNSNPQVRTSAISLLCILYKYLGKDVKTLTRDIKESTLKLIDAELDKVQVIDPKESAGKKKKVASIPSGDGKSSGGGGGDLIPPQDISKKITAQIIKDLNGKWGEKKAACENIEKILNTANMRILPNGLNNIMTIFKKKLSDSNKNFVKMIVSLLSKFIEALKQGFKQWSKPIALALIPNLADKNQLMRNECQNCFDKWVEFAGFDSLVIHFPQFLKTDNTEMRIEIMNFFIKHKNKFNKSTGELVYKEMINPLLICLQDRSANVRNAAEDIIKNSISFIPINSYYKKSEDFKPAITKTLKQILDKIKKEVESSAPPESNNNPPEPENNNQKPAANTEQNIPSSNKSTETPNTSSSKKTTNINTKKSEENTHIKNPKKPTSKKNSIQLTETPISTETGLEDSEKNDSSKNNIKVDDHKNYNTEANLSKTMKKPEKDSAKTKKNAQTINVKRAKPKRKLSEDELVNPLSTTMNKQMPASSFSHLASNSTILKKNDKRSFQKNIPQTPKTSAVFLMNVKVIPNKAKRLDKDKRTKFTIETVSKDYFNKLKDQCKGLFIEDFSKKIFSDDFRKQVEAFKEMKNQIDKKINIPIYFDNLDLILKIIGIKIMNNLNPTLMKNFFEFLDSLYIVLSENKYKLNEIESSIIINILIDKLSLNNNTLRETLFSLLNKYIEFMDTNKIMVTVINIALNKNTKIKSDILDLMIDLTMDQKLNIANKTYAKLLCRFLPLYENVIRTKTLSLFQEIYSKIGQELWSIIEISDKDKEFLEDNLILENEEEEEEEDNIDNNEEEEQNENSNDKDNKIDDKEKNTNISNNKNANIEKNNSNSNINKFSSLEMNNNSNNNLFKNKSDSLTKEDLIDILENLDSEDQSEKLNTIITIHEIICAKFEQNKDCLIANIDIIIKTFKKVSQKLFFVKDLKTIPIKFAKYLAIVLCKLASNKELISKISYEVLLDLSRELLKYLLINGLDKIGENQEGNIIFKSINSTMLRLLENCDTNSVISALLELIKEFYEKNDKSLISLTVKCLLKTTHNLSENINNIQMDKILLKIHLLLLSLQADDPDMRKKTDNNNLIINTLKNIVGDFTKIKKDKILEDYSKSVKNHQLNDKFILKWIKAILDKNIK